MIAPARIAAYEVLRAVSEGRANLATAIARSRRYLCDDRDRALVGEITAGVQRWRAALDHVLAVAARRSIDRLDPEILDILRLSAYQLLYLVRVPASAVVDDAVDLVRRSGKRSAAGLVNAVLRTVSRRRNQLPLPPRPPAPTDRARAIEYLSITLSHPRWLVERWYDRYGFEPVERWLRFDNEPAPLTLRANRLRISRDDLRNWLATHDVMASPGRFAPDALVVERGRAVPLEREGLFIVQDEASQLVPLLSGPNTGARVLDACAAPGNKTTALAAAMGNAGLLVACDVRRQRMQLLRRTVTAAGASNVRLVRADLLAPLPFSKPFDCVVVDAPCSGLGILRRDPDIRWRRSEDDLPALAAAQVVMLQRAADAVVPGGRLVYATCSSEPEENEGVAAAFLASTRSFAAVDLRADAQLPAAVVDAKGHMRTSPPVHGLEAFFGAAFIRRV